MGKTIKAIFRVSAAVVVLALIVIISLESLARAKLNKTMSLDNLRITVLKSEPASEIKVASQTNEYNGHLVYKCGLKVPLTDWYLSSDYSYDFSVNADIGYYIDLDEVNAFSVRFNGSGLLSVFMGTDAVIELAEPKPGKPSFISGSLLVFNENRSLRANEELIKTHFFNILPDLIISANQAKPLSGSIGGIEYTISVEGYSPLGFESIRAEAEEGAVSLFKKLFEAQGLKINTISVRFQ